LEVTTGPLGQGISSAVGLAIAQEHMAATYNKPGFELFNNYTFCILGDGCLQEGVASEAAALAGHLKLGKLIALYDDNHISIDGDTALGFTEDVCKRFESYGWHTLVVSDGDNDLAGLEKAIKDAQSVTDKPTIIKIRTTIGFGSKNQGEEKVHGAPLGKDDLAQTKTKLGFNAEEFFHVPAEVAQFWKEISAKNAQLESEWTAKYKQYGNQYPELAAEIERRFNSELPKNFKDLLPKYTPQDSAVATRKLSEAVLNKIAEALPELVGGSADLTGSNLTRWKTARDFQHPSTKLGDYAGRYIRFGVREHGMAAVCNGIHAYGGFIPFGATFFNFIGYAAGAVRLSALSKHQVLYIMTHDSIGLGEDGPTHQPIETLASIRSLPNLLSLRPADGNETSGCYLAALENKTRPSVLILTRQNLPQLEGSSIEKTLKGAYVLNDAAKPAVCFVGTGSEVSLCVEASKLLSAEGIPSRVVSMPCWELFEEQSQEYKESVFPKGVPVVSVEAMSTFGWSRFAHVSIGLDTFGYSAPYQKIYEKVGLVGSVIAEKAKKTIAYYKGVEPEYKLRIPF
jgi:transketolase